MWKRRLRGKKSLSQDLKQTHWPPFLPFKNYATVLIFFVGLLWYNQIDAFFIHSDIFVSCFLFNKTFFDPQIMHVFTSVHFKNVILILHQGQESMKNCVCMRSM